MATITGTSNNDSLVGTDDGDVISGLNSQDSIDGGLGDDTLFGGEGNDQIEGGAGNDTLEGGSGQDALYGGDGDDVLIDDDPTGNQSADSLFGGAGDDTIVLSGNNDTAFGGTGSDFFNIEVTSNFNQIFIDGNEDSDNGDNDVINFAALYQLYPDLQLIYEAGGPDTEDGRILIRTAPNGQELGRLTYRNIEQIICFTPGTTIATPAGERAVEHLREGDKVFTRDNGIQEVRWIGHSDLGPMELAAKQEFQPIRIKAGALGNGQPEQDLLLSPNHRVLMTGQRAALNFEETEVLSAAKHLTGMPGIDILEVPSVRYVHILFDHHEVILSNGAWTESFQPADYSLRGIGDEQRAEIFSLFPELKNVEMASNWSAARKVLKRHEARLLTA